MAGFYFMTDFWPTKFLGRQLFGGKSSNPQRLTGLGEIAIVLFCYFTSIASFQHIISLNVLIL